jgi:hypothetical protein
VFGDVGVSRAQGFRWLKMFSEGRTNVEVELCSGRPSATSGLPKVLLRGGVFTPEIFSGGSTNSVEYRKQ